MNHNLFILKIYTYENKVNTVMVNNSTNIDDMKNHLSP